MRWKLLLRPGWLAATVAVFGFAIVCYTLLAPWQFSRHEGQAAQNAAVQSSFGGTAQPLPRAGRADEWQRVAIEGTYLPDDEVIARLRTVQGEPAFEVLTPMRTTGGELVLIDRGYVRPGDRSGVPPYASPPPGQVRVEARVRTDETDPGERDAITGGTRGKPQTYAVDSRAVSRITGLDLRAGYFQLAEGQPGTLNALPLPRLDAGPYLSYALQWIAFGTMALLAWLYFTVRELRPGGVLATGERHPQRRKSVAELLAEDEADEDRADDPDDAVSPGTGDADQAGTPARRT